MVWLIVTGSVVLADSTNDGELEYFVSETACKSAESVLTEEYEAELAYCVSNHETVFIVGNQIIDFH